MSNFLASLQPMKNLKLFLPKRTLLVTTILLIPILFIEIGLSYWLNLCFSITVALNFVVVSFVPIYIFKNVFVIF